MLAVGLPPSLAPFSPPSAETHPPATPARPRGSLPPAGRVRPRVPSTKPGGIAGGPGSASSWSALTPPPLPPGAPFPLFSPLCSDRKQPHSSPALRGRVASPHKRRLFGNKHPPDTLPPRPPAPSPRLTLAAVLLAVAGAHPAGFMPAATPAAAGPAAAAARRAPWPPRARAGARRRPAPPSSRPAPVVIHGAPPPCAGAPPASVGSAPPPPPPRSPAASPGKPPPATCCCRGGTEGGRAAPPTTFVSGRRLLPAPSAAGTEGGGKEEGRKRGPAPAGKDAETGLGGGWASESAPSALPRWAPGAAARSPPAGSAPSNSLITKWKLLFSSLRAPVLFCPKGQAVGGPQLPLPTAPNGAWPVIKGAQHH